MRVTYYRKEENQEAQLTSTREAKRLLKMQGGRAWIEHYDREGSMFEVSEIQIQGNNTAFKYDRHL